MSYPASKGGRQLVALLRLRPFLRHPFGFVLDGPLQELAGVAWSQPIRAPALVNGNPHAAVNTRIARVFRLDAGWEIRAPADAVVLIGADAINPSSTGLIWRSRHDSNMRPTV
jgi:hypothetical protein